MGKLFWPKELEQKTISAQICIKPNLVIILFLEVGTQKSKLLRMALVLEFLKSSESLKFCESSNQLTNQPTNQANLLVNAQTP